MEIATLTDTTPASISGSAPAGAPVPASPDAAADKSHLWDGKEFGFTDVLAALNPLQHLPIVGPLYRALTGDTIGNVARVVGDTLYGGPIGLITGLINVAVAEETGTDIGGHVIALFDSDDKPAPTDVAATPAEATPAELAPAAAPPVERPAEPQPAPAATLAAASRPAAGAIALPGGAKAFPIDMTRRGVGQSNLSNQVIPLTLSGGVLARQTAPVAPVDFVARMQEGLDKYNRLNAARLAAMPRDDASGQPASGQATSGQTVNRLE
jgi:hypothetical protein